MPRHASPDPAVGTHDDSCIDEVRHPAAVVADGNEVFLRLDSREYVRSPVSRKEHCPHAGD